jgi:hypothetical protein
MRTKLAYKNPWPTYHSSQFVPTCTGLTEDLTFELGCDLSRRVQEHKPNMYLQVNKLSNSRSSATLMALRSRCTGRYLLLPESYDSLAVIVCRLSMFRPSLLQQLCIAVLTNSLSGVSTDNRFRLGRAVGSHACEGRLPVYCTQEEDEDKTQVTTNRSTIVRSIHGIIGF